MSKFSDNIITKSIWEWYQDAWDKRDKRTDNWPLMSSPLPIIFSIVMYNVITVKIGPMLMKNREAFNLRNVIVFYNVCMVVFNGYLVYQIWTLAWGNDYNWVCEPLDKSLNPRSLNIANCMWLYFMCKYLDWLDTKYRHLSTLHVYHHSIMPWLGWFGTRVMPGGQATLTILLNSGIHVIMHSYYCLAALGPRYRKYLWWKKYLTLLQLVHFAILITHGLQIFWHNCDIGIPNEWAIPVILNPVLFFILFSQFYQQAYDQKQISSPDSNSIYSTKPSKQ